MSESTDVWARICIKLLKGPVYYEDEKADVWNNLLSYRDEIDQYFSTIGLKMVISEEDGYAYLIQKSDLKAEGMGQDEEEQEEIQELPRLIRRSTLSFDASLLCVILRDLLDKFDYSTGESRYLIYRKSEIKDFMRPFIKEKSNEDKLDKRVDRAISSLCDLTYLKPMKAGLLNQQIIEDDAEFEVRTILKAKIGTDALKDFLMQLDQASKEKEGEDR